MSERPSSRCDCCRRIGAERLEEGRRQVDRLDQLVADRAARRVGLGRGIADDQRHLHRRLVEQVLLAQPVVAQIVAVVGGEDDQRVVEQARAPRMKRNSSAQLIVDLLDEPHVDGDHLVAHLVARERPAHAQVHELAIDRMRIARAPPRERTAGSTSAAPYMSL